MTSRTSITPSDLQQWSQQFISDALGHASLTTMQQTLLPHLFASNFSSNPQTVFVLDPHQMSSLMNTYAAMVDSHLSRELIQDTPPKVYVGLHIAPLMLDISKIFAATPEQSGDEHQQSLRRAQWLQTMRQVQSITKPVLASPPTITSVQGGQAFRRMMLDWARFCMEGPILDLDEVEQVSQDLARHMATQWLSVANPPSQEWDLRSLSRLHHLVERVIPDAAPTRLTALHVINLPGRLTEALTPIMRQALTADGLARLDVRCIHIDRSINVMNKELTTDVGHAAPRLWKTLWTAPAPAHPDHDVVIKACVQQALKLARHPSATLTDVFATFRPQKSI